MSEALVEPLYVSNNSVNHLNTHYREIPDIAILRTWMAQIHTEPKPKDRTCVKRQRLARISRMPGVSLILQEMLGNGVKIITTAPGLLAYCGAARGSPMQSTHVPRIAPAPRPVPATTPLVFVWLLSEFLPSHLSIPMSILQFTAWRSPHDRPVTRG